MLIIVCCITILITYILIFGLLTYYFIKKRLIWNELFNINNITDTLVEIFACPEHFIIYIPGIVFENTDCVEKSKMINKNKEKIKKLLTKINTIFKKINDINIEYENNENDSNDGNIKKSKWILEGTIDNFNHMYEETSEFYNKLSGSYSILHSKNNHDKTGNHDKNKLITLENLVVIENNIEYCDNILKILELIDLKDYEDMFQIKNNYMISLIYNLIENVRMYKIKMYKMINM